MTTREKLYDKKDKRAKLVKAAGELLNKDDLESYAAKTAEIDQLNTTIEALEKQIQLEENFGGEAAPASGVEKTPKVEKHGGADPKLEEQRKAFFKAARNGFPKVIGKGAQMSEGVDADGGYTVPKDVQTRINHYRESQQCLANEVEITPVKTESGSRVYRKRSAAKGFVTQAEAAKITGKSQPAFEILEYKVVKRSAYTPVTRELLEDSDADIEAEVVDWMGRENVATGNTLVLTAVKTNSAQDLKDLDGIKAAWLKLGSALRPGAKLYTNDNGLVWLAALKDTTGRPLLNPNPANTSQLQLCVGAMILPVEPYDVEALPNDAGTKIPMIVGNLREGIEIFERRGVTITSSSEATVGTINAFEQDMVIWKGSVRNDCKVKDKAAFVNGFINTAV